MTGAGAGLYGVAQSHPKACTVYLVLTFAAVGLMWKHVSTIDRMARWQCALAEISMAEDKLAADISSMHAKGQLAFSGLALRMSTLDHYLTDLHTDMHKNITSIAEKQASAEYYRRLWKNADKSFVEDRMSALLAIAQQLADLPKSSARFREKLAELADHVGSALSPDAQKELTERFAETTSTALRLATRLQTISKTGTQMSPQELERLMSDLERSMSAVMGYLTTVESIAEKGAGAASTAAEIRDTLESVAPLHTISADLSVIMDALGRMAGGDSHYATMDIGPIDQVKEGWNQRFESIKGAHVDSPGHLLVNQYPGYTEQLPERCITAQKEDLALRWIMLPDLAVSLVGMYAASACLF